MKWIVLLMAQLRRNPKRSMLTFTAIMLALFMFSTLQSVLDSLQIKPSGAEEGRRLALIEETGGPRTELPVRYTESIQKVPHIQTVSPLKFTITSPGESATGPYYVTFAVDAEAYTKIYSRLFESVDTSELACMKQSKSGALVGREILNIQNWTIGEDVTLYSLLHDVAVPLHICGDIEDLHQLYPGSETQLIVHAIYYGELSQNPDKVNMFWISLDDEAYLNQVEEALRETFQWDEYQVTLQSEGAMMAQISEFTATIQQIIRLISSAVLVTILIVSANTIAISTRERYPEIALLKVLGFKKTAILILIIAESMVLAVIGGMAGTGLTWLLFRPDPVRQLLGMTYAYSLPESIYWSNLVISLLLGGISGFIPALRATEIYAATLLQR